MSIQISRPPTHLQNYIRYYWEFSSSAEEPCGYTHPIFPTGLAELTFQFGNPYTANKQQAKTISKSFIAGQTLRPYSVTVWPGVRFFLSYFSL